MINKKNLDGKDATNPTTDLFAFGLRMEKSLQASLKQAAKNNHRSLNAEIVSRLEKSVESETAKSSDFSRIQAKNAWFSLAETVGREFLAVNYLSFPAWAESGGDSNCAMIGARMKSHRGLAKRLFILDKASESEQWKSVWELHHLPAAPVEVKQILRADFELLRQQFIDEEASLHADMNSTLGFVVLDELSLAEWHYDAGRRAERVHVSALDKEKATRFKNLFTWVWESSYSHPC